MRKPMALANWKMAMTVAESLEFADKFTRLIEGYIPYIDVVICPPCTSIHPLSSALKGSGIQLGAQDISPHSDPAHTGSISAKLVSHAGGMWFLAGHWEVRREKGDGDPEVNAKLRAGISESLKPIVLVGEEAHEKDKAIDILNARLPILFRDVNPEAMAGAAIVYEPAWTIGAKEPAPPEHIWACCKFIREWIEERFGSNISSNIRILYGGSVTPEVSKALLASPHIDGLGAGRKGRDPVQFASIVREIYEARYEK